MPSLPAELPTRHRSVLGPLVAWVVILGVVAVVVWRNQSTAAIKDDESATQLMQDRAAIGLPAVMGRTPGLYASIRANQEHPSWRRRLRLAVIAGEVSGPKEAREELARAREAVARKDLEPPSPEEARLADILDALYSRYESKDWSGGLTAEDREELRRQMAWWGELALTPEQSDNAAHRQEVLAPARRVAFVMLGYLSGLILLGMVGVLLGVVLLILWLTGNLREGLQPGTGHGGIYAETFAMYLVLFILLGLGARFLHADEKWLPLQGGVVALLGLAALGWPVLRGVPWRQVRRDIGWTAGRSPALEPVIGVGCYVVAVPLVLVGLLLFLLITNLERRLGVPVEPPNHPLPGWMMHSSWWGRLQLILDACVIAPIVEETMFRGVLYRHLREAIGKFASGASVFGSAIVSSVLFAVIHPQGIAFVPVLGALAFTFALAREWRGTLIPSMTAHGIANGVTMLLLLLTMG